MTHKSSDVHIHAVTIYEVYGREKMPVTKYTENCRWNTSIVQVTHSCLSFRLSTWTGSDKIPETQVWKGHLNGSGKHYLKQFKSVSLKG